MVKLFSTEHTFHHPFETVTSAFWRKYPNEKASHVRAIDAFDRRIDCNGNLIVNRIVKCESQLPAWLKSIGAPQGVFAVETTVVNPITKQMVIKSRNISGSSMMVIEETCYYRPSNDGYNHTKYTQEALITAFLPMLRSKFESYTHNNLQGKSADGLATIEALCQRIQKGGVSALIDPLIEAAKSAGAHIQHAYADLAKSKEALAVAGINTAAPSSN